MDGKPETWQPLLDAAESNDVTLLFSAHDLEHNNAVTLKAYLDKQLKREEKIGSEKPRDARSAFANREMP